jgi:hypothetical protein
LPSPWSYWWWLGVSLRLSLILHVWLILLYHRRRDQLLCCLMSGDSLRRWDIGRALRKSLAVRLLQISLCLWFRVWILLKRVYPLDMILMFRSMHGEEFFWFWTSGLGAILYQTPVWCLGTPQSRTDFFLNFLLLSL